MNLKRLIVIGLFFTVNLLNAQSDFRPGYIIDNSGDTIYGEIDYRGDLMMGNACRVKLDKTVYEYSPYDITGFRFTGSRYYISKDIKGKKAFVEYLIKGKLNVYYLRDNIGDHYFLEKDDLEFKEIPFTEGIRYAGNSQRFYASTKHMGLLSYYMKDAPQFQRRIFNIKKPNHSNLINLAEDYHNAVCKGENCIIYEKPSPFISLSLEPFWGLIKYSGYNQAYQELGCNLYIGIPMANEKLHFKTGILYNKIPEEEGDLFVLKIPVQIQYLYQAYRIEPKVSFGVNIFMERLNEYSNVFNTLSLNAGINFRINKSISLSSGFNSDYTPLMIVLMDEDNKFGIISYAINLGLWIEL
jgi:hypothetical protein